MANTTLKPADDKSTRLDVIHTNNYPVLFSCGPTYPVGFIEKPNNIDIEAEIEKKYHGLLLDKHVIKDAASKARAQRLLRGWRYVELTAQRWIEHLCAGHIIQPSVFEPAPDGTYTHTKDYWQQTHFVCCDADNIRGVEFLSDGTDKNPNGVEPFTTHTGLEQFPSLQFKVYAITESVSSMHKEPPHRRYRLIFLFDEPIRSEKHYHQILLALAAEFPIIPPVERSPAQPIFGNARHGHHHAARLGNILKTSEYPYQEPEPEHEHEPKQRGNQRKATDAELYRLLNENNIPSEPRQRGGFFVQCPNAEQHTGGKHGRTDAYVFIGDKGAKAFHCSHASCQATGKSTWAAFKEGYHIKTSHRAYIPKQRLYIKTDAQHIKIDAMGTIRTLLKNNVLDWLLKVYDTEKKQVLIINTGTATGKSHIIMATVENLIMLTPTKELAEEAYNKAVTDFGKNAVLHKSRWHNWTLYREYLENRNHNRADLEMSLTEPDAVTCREPEMCDAIQRKGHSARDKLCEFICPWRGECKNHGYLSQYRRYQDKTENRLQVYTAQPQDAITDAELQETIQAYGLRREGTVLVVDEADPIKMIPTRKIRFEAWRKAADFYKGTSAGIFFEILLQETATVQNIITTDDIEACIQQINENGYAFRKAIQRAFDAFETRKQGLKTVQKIFDEIANWGLDKAEIDPQLEKQHDQDPTKITAQIDALPDNHVNLIDTLQAFLESTQESKTPPARNLAEGTWELAVPATLNAKYNIFLTANNTAPLICQQLRDVNAEISQSENTIAPWHPSTKLYQINTGRYTPRSLFYINQKTKYKPNGEQIKVDDSGALTPRGEQIIERIIETLKDNIHTLIVAPKAFCEQELWNTNSLIRKLHTLPNAHIATHQHAIGVNKYSELPRAFIFHYEPDVLELVFVVKANHPNETIDFTREKITLETHGVRLEDVWRYKDTRVQQIYDALCANAMMQSENRIRPQLYKNKEIWRLSAEPIPAPATPILFSIPDWQAWMDTDRTETFDIFLTTRYDRTIAEVTTGENISTSQAYRRTETARRENKATRDAEIIRLHNEGHKQSDIVMHISKYFGKINKSTISRVIKSDT